MREEVTKTVAFSIKTAKLTEKCWPPRQRRFGRCKSTTEGADPA